MLLHFILISAVSDDPSNHVQLISNKVYRYASEGGPVVLPDATIASHQF